MLHGLARYFHVCKSAGRFFTDPEKDAIYNSGHEFLYMYSELRLESLQQGTNLFHLVPKFHQYHHLILDAWEDGYNPRYFHCFGDEDQVGKLLNVAAASHCNTVVSNSVDLYLIGLSKRVATFK